MNAVPHLRPIDIAPPPSPTEGELARCVDTFRRWLYLPDPGSLYFNFGVIVSNLADGDPVWGLQITPPSRGKTETTSPFAALPYVHQVAVMTEAALLSGTPKKEQTADAKGGLLRQIGAFGIVLMKDFTSVLAQNRDTRAQVLAAMREIYDGSWTRHVGTDGGRTLHWEGKVGLLAGCTPAIDLHHAVIATMGERFIFYRPPKVDDETVIGRRALAHNGHEVEMRAELTDAVTRVLATVNLNTPVERTDEDDDRLIDLAIFTATARTPVARDGYDREVLMMPEAEGPGRLARVLCQLRDGLLRVGCTHAQAWEMLANVATGSMPSVRRRLVEHILAVGGEIRTGDAATATGVPTKTARYHLEDAALLGLVKRTKTSTADNAADVWSITDWTEQHWPSGTESQGGE